MGREREGQRDSDGGTERDGRKEGRKKEERAGGREKGSVGRTPRERASERGMKQTTEAKCNLPRHR